MYKYLEVDSGVDLYVEDVGEGSPIVFIPGFTFTTEMFEKQVEYFSKSNRVIVVDPRSHGRSTITLHGNDYMTHGTDLGKVLQALHVENPIIVGWSFGCFTAWEYAKQQGYENIKGLVLVDMPPKSLSIHSDDWVEGALDDIASLYNAFLTSTKGQREFISGYIKDVMIQRDLEEADLKWMVEQSMKTPYYIAGNLFASGMFADYRKEAKEASEKIPTLTVVAEHWSETALNYLEKHIPNTKVEVLGGHAMFWEHSETFNKIVDDFQARLD